MTGLLIYLIPLVGGALKVGVIIYCSLLISMLIASIFRVNYTSNKSWIFIVIGAILFVSSDSTLAIGKFGHMVSWY